MSRTFQDKNLLVWEVYPSAGNFGFSENPHIVFNCLSNRMVRPRYVEHGGDEADAERTVSSVSVEELQRMLAHSREVD